MTRHFVTACLAEQLPVLLASMRRHCAPFRLHVLAWDFDPHDWPVLGPDVEITPREAFLAAHPECAPDRLPGPPRSALEIACTVRWTFLAGVMERTGDAVTLVDGDVHWFSSPGPMFVEIGGAAMAVSPHRIPPAAAGLPGVTLETHRRYGLYNAGITSFADPAPAHEMAELTRQWCYAEVRTLSDGREVFFDQGWLEDVACRHGAHIIQHPA
jgi:hypothetical protein